MKRLWPLIALIWITLAVMPLSVFSQQYPDSYGGGQPQATGPAGKKSWLNVGVKFNHLGSFDDVTTVNSESGTNSGDVLEVDGEYSYSYFIELKGDPKQAGFQTLRYESSLENAGDDFNQVSPLNSRGEAADSISEKRSAFQSLNTDLAPIYGYPQILAWINEERFVSKVRIKSLASNENLYYIPLDSRDNAIPLTEGEEYYFEVKLEEVMIGYRSEIIGIPVRVGLFDMVYQKPVLIENQDQTEGNTNNIYAPRFEVQGWQIETMPLLQGTFFNVDTSLEVTYGQSTHGRMHWRHVSDIEANTSENVSNDVNVYKWMFKLDLDWKSAFQLTASTKGLLIRLENLDTKEDYTISLDAINSISLLYKF